ncbi:MAG TPA: 4-alpha-glucanotransferase [Streptosporangiaceae bacterium]
MDIEDLARQHGVAVSYTDWRGRKVRVADETLTAILAALGDPAAEPPGAPLLDAAVAPAPPTRAWGFTVQLYSVRSRASWGHGDLHDLADLTRWSARDLGADFVQCNPLHAAEPLPPVSASPYLAMTRRFISPLYLRIEDIPEYAAEQERITAMAAPLRASNTAGGLIDRDAVWAAKRAALEILWAVPRTTQRQAAFDRFRASQGTALDDWATWCALAELHGPDWRSWPAPLRDPRSGAVARERGRLASQVRFHAWLQWLASDQLAAAQATARAAGMSIGIIPDLAIGAHPGGADAWSNPGVVAQGVSVGAPPDEFNQHGQDWSLPPWHPGRLAAEGYRPLTDLIASTLTSAGGIRVDHVMGLLRLWWIPAGMSPAQGAYVYYGHKEKEMVGVLAAQAARASALAIGEDLGTVDPWIRDCLSARGVLGTSMLWFERAEDGSPLPPSRWRTACLATVGTHDVPPATAFFTGDQVTLRASLGLLTRAEAAERADADEALAAWRTALASQGLLRADEAATPEQFTTALYAYLARTPAALIGVSLAEAAGERRPQNLPGTSTQYPNWQIPLADGTGAPLLAEDLPSHPGIQTIAQAMTRKR